MASNSLSSAEFQTRASSICWSPMRTARAKRFSPLRAATYLQPVFWLRLGPRTERPSSLRHCCHRSAASSTNSLSTPERCARSSPPTAALGRPHWLPDGDALLVPMRDESGGAQGQLWKVSYPSGEAQRLTNDLTDYSLPWLDLTADGSAVVTVETTFSSDLWAAPAGDSARATQITSGGPSIFGRFDFGQRSRSVRQSQSRALHRELRRQRSDSGGRQRSQHPVRVRLRRREAHRVLCPARQRIRYLAHGRGRFQPSAVDPRQVRASPGVLAGWFDGHFRLRGSTEYVGAWELTARIPRR